MTDEISGDIRLSIGDRLRYLWRNFLRVISSVGRGTKSTAFRPSDTSIARLTTQSPSRFLTEAFFAENLRALLPDRPLSILEVGCGSGSLSARMAGLGVTGSYLGIDIGNRFAAKSTDEMSVDFLQTDAHLFAPEPSSFDLIISVSALEHIPRDKDLIAKFPSFLRPGGIQVQVVPAGASLAGYLWHGYRQYTPLMLAERFPHASLVRLGGLASLVFHMIFITPEMFVRRFFRSRFPKAYRNLLLGALALDRLLPICPTSFVVISRH